MIPDLSFICIADRPDNLRHLIACLRLQTNPRWELLVLDQTPRAACLAPVQEVEALGERRLQWYSVPHFGDHGQTVKYGYTIKARGEYVCYPCDDGYYVPIFVQDMVSYARMNKWDMIYCNFLLDEMVNLTRYQAYDVAPVIGRVDGGGFIVKPQFVIEDGWGDRTGTGDGALVERLVKKCSHGKFPLASIMYVKN